MATGGAPAPVHLLLWPSLLALLGVLAIGVVSAADADVDGGFGGWSWTKILSSRAPIVANGNVWPPPADESADACLVLVTRNQLMWHCPPGNATHPYERHVLHIGAPGKYRGAFAGLGGTDDAGRERRLWILHSPDGADDQLREVDTVTGDVLQTLEVDGCIDGHDAIRVGERAFLVDTRHGDVVEIDVPPASEPYTAASVAAGAVPLEREGHVNVVKRHTGFTRADHLNNIAIHPDLLVSNLHGKGAIKANLVKDTGHSPTRLSALRRDLPSDEGRELTLEEDGFASVNNVGTWCHGIAFWEEPDTGQINLISLDSKEGSLVSVTLTGPDPGRRTVLWTPEGKDHHPVLTAPEGIAQAYHNGAKQFSKGLAVQGGVAYFGVSYARAPPLRQTVPESLLVAVDLKTRKEVWARTVRSNGIINQIMTRGALGDILLPAELSSVELTQHAGGGKLVDRCQDREVNHPGLCDLAVAADASDREMGRAVSATCSKPRARELCCVCRGGERTQVPHLAGQLDAEILKIDEEVAVTATFVPRQNCRDKHGRTRHLSLEHKTKAHLAQIDSIHRDLDAIVKHVCNLDVAPVQDQVTQLGNDGFTHDYQRAHGNAIIFNRDKPEQDRKVIQLISSSKRADKVYHFPWLKKFLPMLREHVLRPLGIPVNHIMRLQLANRPQVSDIRFHTNSDAWVAMSHRTHVPIITNADVFFLAKVGKKEMGGGDATVLRIKADAGEVFEFNNGIPQAVRNLGGSPVHLIIDYAEGPLYWEDYYGEEDATEALVKLRPGETCTQSPDSPYLECTGPNETEEL